MAGAPLVRLSSTRRELLPGQAPVLLQSLHILTRAGALDADRLRKLKQVNHLARLPQPAVAAARRRESTW